MMLLSHRETETYYLIPPDVHLPLGELKLQTMNGEEYYVDAQAADPYRLTQEEAREWLKAQGREAIASATIGIQSFFTSLARGDHNTKPQTPDGDTSNVNFDLFADLMGETPDDLLNDLEARRRGWSTVLNGMAEVLSDALSDDPERMENARAVMHVVDEIMQAHGVETQDALKDLPDYHREQHDNDAMDDDTP